MARQEKKKSRESRYFTYIVIINFIYIVIIIIITVQVLQPRLVLQGEQRAERKIDSSILDLEIEQSHCFRFDPLSSSFIIKRYNRTPARQFNKIKVQVS